VTATLDRYLGQIGQPQIYGTQTHRPRQHLGHKNLITELSFQRASSKCSASIHEQNNKGVWTRSTVPNRARLLHDRKQNVQIRFSFICQGAHWMSATAILLSGR
jgi:hypothetical protein